MQPLRAAISTANSLLLGVLTKCSVQSGWFIAKTEVFSVDKIEQMISRGKPSCETVQGVLAEVFDLADVGIEPRDEPGVAMNVWKGGTKKYRNSSFEVRDGLTAAFGTEIQQLGMELTPLLL